MVDTEIRFLDNGLLTYPALSVSPVGLTAYRIICDRAGNSPLKKMGIRPPLEHKEKGFISKKGQKSIKNAVYWFLYSVDRELVISGKGKKKVGFLTLTLPSKQVHSDKQIKKECLNQFLTEIRNDYDVKKYIWKAEKQENGGIHFHILTDVFLPVVEIRNKWNRIINKLGYVYEYSQKMKKLTFEEYKIMRLNELQKIKRPVVEKIKLIKKAYEKGKKEKWMNPNSIDIESLKKVKNVGAYIGKYMSKEHKRNELKVEEKNALSVDGRLWYSSTSVSKMKNLIIEGMDEQFIEFVDMMSDARYNDKIFETVYTTTLSVPVDTLHKHGFKEIPQMFFDYAKDVFNGFKYSEFEKEKLEKDVLKKPEKKKDNIVQAVLEFDKGIEKDVGRFRD